MADRTTCQVGRDGECVWDGCPQAVDCQPVCPLAPLCPGTGRPMFPPYGCGCEVCEP